MNDTLFRKNVGQRLFHAAWQCFKNCYDGSCRIQLIGLQSKSIDWFVCDRSSHFGSHAKIA